MTREQYLEAALDYLASCHAATLEYDCKLRSTSNGRVARFLNIADTMLQMGEGSWEPKTHTARPGLGRGMDRLRRAKGEMA